MAIDWTSGNSTGDPKLTTLYTLLLTQLKERDENIAKMDFTGDSNKLTGFIRANVSGGGLIERWSGSGWVDILTDYTSHLTNTSNPHVVDKTDVDNTGAHWNANKLQGTDITGTGPANSDLLQYTGTVWEGRNFSEIGLATSTDLTTHTAISNPHATSSNDVGAFKITNYLSEIPDASSRTTARGNLGLGSLATENTVNDSDFSGTLSVGKGGTNATTAAAARGQLVAAESGGNSDINSLATCTTMGASGVTTIGSSAGNTILRWDSSNRLEGNGADFAPVSPGGINLGTATNYFNGINVSTVLAPSGRLLLHTKGTDDMWFGTQEIVHIVLDHSDSTFRPAGGQVISLGRTGDSWHGLHINIVNFTPSGGEGSAPGSGAVGRIAIQVDGAARSIATYAA